MSRLPRIVVGVATIDQVDPALPSAIRLAESTGAELHVVHVVDLPLLSADADLARAGVLVPDGRTALFPDVAGKLERSCNLFANAETSIKVHVLTGSAHQHIARLAADLGAQLIVVGSTRRGRIWRSILGTTAERVLRASSVPVLVMHQPFFQAVERILLTTDLSELSAGIHEQALDVVERLFTPTAVDCRSLLVLSPELPGTIGDGGLAERLARIELDAFLGKRRPRTYSVGGRVRAGEPSVEINVEAGAWQADLIVLGTHGRDGLARYVFGSVAAATIRDATRNVLVIPAASQSGAAAGGEDAVLATAAGVFPQPPSQAAFGG